MVVGGGSVLARATLNGLVGWIVACGPPDIHTWFKEIKNDFFGSFSGQYLKFCKLYSQI